MSLRGLRIHSGSALLALTFVPLFVRLAASDETRAVDDVLNAPPALLANVEQQRRILAGKVRAEVDSVLASAKPIMRANPAQAEQELKLILEDIDQTPELDEDLRSQLHRQVTSAIRQARIQKIAADQRAVEALESK